MNENKKMNDFLFKNFFFLILLNMCNYQQPADKGKNDKTKQILDYIENFLQKYLYIII